MAEIWGEYGDAAVNEVWNRCAAINAADFNYAGIMAVGWRSTKAIIVCNVKCPNLGATRESALGGVSTYERGLLVLTGDDLALCPSAVSGMAIGRMEGLVLTTADYDFTDSEAKPDKLQAASDGRYSAAVLDKRNVRHNRVLSRNAATEAYSKWAGNMSIAFKLIGWIFDNIDKQRIAPDPDSLTAMQQVDTESSEFCDPNRV